MSGTRKVFADTTLAVTALHVWAWPGCSAWWRSYVFGLWSGALADAMDRLTLMMITTAGLCATAMAFWLQALLGLGNVWLVLGLFAVMQFGAIVGPLTGGVVVAAIALPASIRHRVTG